MKRTCAVTILAQNAKQGTPLSHSKQVPCDKEAPRLVSRRPACGNGAHAPAVTYAPTPHDPRLRPLAALAESRGPLSQNSCQPEGLQPESALAALLVLRRFWTFAATSALPSPILAATHTCFIMLRTLGPYGCRPFGKDASWRSTRHKPSTDRLGFSVRPRA